MRPSRVFRLIIRIILLLLTLSLSLISFLGGLSAFIILSDPNNISVPSGDSQGNLTVYDGAWNKMGTYDHVFFEMPFEINNVGYFNLENLKVGLIVAFIYDHISVGPENETTIVKILDHEASFPVIKRGESYEGIFEAYYKNDDHDGFDFSELPDKTEIDIFAGISYAANITLSCKYSLALLNIRVSVYEFPLPEDIF